MAEKKTTTKKTSPKTSTTKKTETKSTTTTKRTKRSGGTGIWSLNKISFWCIGAMAILYLVASILALCGLQPTATLALQGVATALAICLVACLAWRYVKNKQTVWKVLYVVLLLVVVLGIIVPLIKY